LPPQALFARIGLVIRDGEGIIPQPISCSIINQDPFNPNCVVASTGPINLTPEELKACQCELLAYTTALNEVAGISVTGGPPYVCGNVDCGPPTIPTLNEWGLLAMAGILGLVGFMVIRRRKATT